MKTHFLTLMVLFSECLTYSEIIQSSPCVWPGQEGDAAAATYDEAAEAYHDHGYDDGSTYDADPYDESAAYTNEHGNYESEGTITILGQ